MDLYDVSLRPFRLTDANDLFSWAGDDQVTRSIRWKTLTSIEEATTFIREVCIPHPWRRSICVNDRSIGFVSIYPGSGDDRCRADVGYALSVEFWGRGIATMAVKLAVPQVFRDLPDVIRVQAYVDVENKASQRVLEKAGFVKEGVLRKYSYIKGKTQDLVVFSVLSNDAIPL
ncbi:hypothetical protein Leryth_027673 [Lithospermum erythrorhizon]|nr:hypothetical protein Leryth_027673 [Lithospermum erythrorhizon]